MVDIRSLFGYNWYSRRRFLESMAKLPWKELVENRGASFDSMRNIFVHSLEAEQGWLRRLRGMANEWPRHDYDGEFPSVEAMRKYMDEVEAENRGFLEKLGPEDLNKVFDASRNVCVEDVLMHVVEEEIHHRGELICLMWQIGVEPPYTSYSRYASETRSPPSTG